MSEGVNQQLNPRPDLQRAQSTRIVLEQEAGIKSIETLAQFIGGAGRHTVTKQGGRLSGQNNHLITCS